MVHHIRIIGYQLLIRSVRFMQVEPPSRCVRVTPQYGILQSLFRSDIFMNMNAVGIDVSKRKSTVAILRPGGKAVGKPFDVPHLSADFQSLIKRIRELDG